MSLGEYIGAGASTTKLLLHLNGSSADSSGNSNSGTDTAITYSQANGRFGQGAGFNGSTSKITGGLVTSLSATPVTFSCWANFTAVTGNPRIFDFSDASYSFQLLYDYDTVSKICTKASQYQASLAGTTWTAISTDVWYNFICVLDGGGSSTKLYINGTEQTGASNNLVGAAAANSTYKLGNRRDDVVPFSGKMDEVITDNYAWTPQQVAKYYTYAKGRFGII